MACLWMRGDYVVGCKLVSMGNLWEINLGLEGALNSFEVYEGC